MVGVPDRCVLRRVHDAAPPLALSLAQARRSRPHACLSTSSRRPPCVTEQQPIDVRGVTGGRGRGGMRTDGTNQSPR